MSEISDLYHPLILEHSRSPLNYYELDLPFQTVEAYNPLCGDQIKIYLKIENNIIKDISFDGSGCAISTASASIMTESVKGKTLEEARALFEKFHCLATGGVPADEEGLEKLKAFAGVAQYPARVKCATLAWHTFKAASSGSNKTITTE